MSQIGQRCQYRRGVAAVEFAFVAPVFLVLVMGMIEVGRGLMVQQVLINATREGARRATLPDATTDLVKSAVLDYATRGSVKLYGTDINVSPDPSGTFNNEQIRVDVQIPYSRVSWVIGKYITSDLRAVTTMRSERFQ